MRITGGTHRSRAILAPKGQATRPTSDRVREALFSILGNKLSWEEVSVLDLYAGSGALSFEAISRGAVHATLVESAKAALLTIRQNIRNLGLENETLVLAEPVERFLGRRLFELVLADPPYEDVRTGIAQNAISRALESLPALPQVLVIEHGGDTVPPSMPGFQTSTSRNYGDTTLTIYES